MCDLKKLSTVSFNIDHVAEVQWVGCHVITEVGELTANPIARGEGRGSAWKTLKDLGLVGTMSQIRRRLFKDSLFSPVFKISLENLNMIHLVSYLVLTKTINISRLSTRTTPLIFFIRCVSRVNLTWTFLNLNLLG